VIFNKDKITTALESSNYKNLKKNNLLFYQFVISNPIIHGGCYVYLSDDYADNDKIRPVCKLLYKRLHVSEDEKIFIVLLLWNKEQQEHVNSSVEIIVISEDNKVLCMDSNYESESIRDEFVKYI